MTVNIGQLSCRLTQSICFTVLFTLPLLVNADDKSGRGYFSGFYSLETQYYKNNHGASNQQKNTGLSLSLQPKYTFERNPFQGAPDPRWDTFREKDYLGFTFSPFLRLDEQDKKRTHADIRQLDLTTSKGDHLVFQVGVSQVHWGSSITNHLVDVINQTDAAEGGESLSTTLSSSLFKPLLGSIGVFKNKLGQPLLRVSYFDKRFSDSSLAEKSDYSTNIFDLSILPYFRERTFAGNAGHLDTSLVVNTDKTSYESSRKQKHPDYALSWLKLKNQSHARLHYFSGTSRDPVLKPIVKNRVAVGLQPHYPLMQQIGLNTHNMLGRNNHYFEGVARKYSQKSGLKDYRAMTVGFNHYIKNPYILLNIFGEYHYDSRGEVANAPFQNDLFIGGSVNISDWSNNVVAGINIDLDNQAKSLRFEASRSLGNNLGVYFKAQAFMDDKNDPSKTYQQSDFIKLGLKFDRF